MSKGKKPTFKEMQEELRTLDAKLSQAKKEFLDAGSVYDTRGIKREKAVLEKLETYLDPDRDEVIRKAALNLQAEVKSFDRLRTALLSRMSLLSIQLNLTAQSLIVDALTWPTSTSSKANDPLDPARSFLHDLDRMQTRLVVLSAMAIIVAENVLAALATATGLINLREAQLDKYLHKVLTIDVDKALDAAEGIVQAQLREDVYKAILEAGAKAIGATAETVAPILKIAVIARELYLKFQELKKLKGRTDVDELLGLTRQLDIENKAIEENLKYFDALREALAKKVPA
jgi:hypothetical protein